MEQPPSQLVYWDKHRIPFNLTLLFALGVAVFGLYNYLQGAGGEILVLAGLGVGVYSWFTNPRQYRIYEDAVVIVYGTPRTKVMQFSQIADLDLRQPAAPDRLRVVPVKGRRVVLMARDPEAFHEQLRKALDEFRRLHPEFAPREIERDPPGAN